MNHYVTLDGKINGDLQSLINKLKNEPEGIELSMPDLKTIEGIVKQFETELSIASNSFEAMQLLSKKLEEKLSTGESSFSSHAKKLSMDEFQKLSVPEQISWKAANPEAYAQMVNNT